MLFMVWGWYPVPAKELSQKFRNIPIAGRYMRRNDTSFTC